MTGLIPYKPLYQAIVFISLAAGIWGIPVTISLVRGAPKAYRNAVWVLVIGAVSSGIQTAVSQSVRGASAPANVRFIITFFTLLVFLLLRLPALRNRVDFSRLSRGEDSSAIGGTALAVCGLVTLTIYWWAGGSHMTSWIDVLRVPIMFGGWTMTIAGVFLLVKTVHQSLETRPMVNWGKLFS